MNPFPEINTRHSALARISESELDILKEIFDDADTRRFLPELYELLDYPDGLHNFIATFVYYSQNDEGYLWGIKHRDEFVGFIADQGADQCGFCNPGFVMNTIALLRENPNPTDDEIRSYLAGNLCRCSGYEGQLRGIRAYLDSRKQG